MARSSRRRSVRPDCVCVVTIADTTNRREEESKNRKAQSSTLVLIQNEYERIGGFLHGVPIVFTTTISLPISRSTNILIIMGKNNCKTGGQSSYVVISSYQTFSLFLLLLLFWCE